jgi:hypothetical protein
MYDNSYLAYFWIVLRFFPIYARQDISKDLPPVLPWWLVRDTLNAYYQIKVVNSRKYFRDSNKVGRLP